MSHAPAQLVAAGPYLAVGDAALAVDPIAGDGVVRALRSAQRAVSTVLQLLEAPHTRQHELLAAYAAEHDAECTRYLHTRVHYYAAEQRFATPYWQRRVRAAQQLSAAAEVTPR
jgi:flavin-dependent dehydrogenase